MSRVHGGTHSEPPWMPSQPNVHPCTFGCFEFFLEKNSILHGTTDILSVQRYFLFYKKVAVKMYTDVHFQNGQRCPGCQSAASFSLEKLVVEPCTRRYTAQQRHGRRRISFFPFVFRYAAVLERERKNLPPMMQ